MNTEILHIGSVDIEVTFKAIKNLHLSVHPPYGKVTIASPDFYDLEKIKIYAATKLGWIKREQDKIRSQEREEPKSMITQESHQFLGKRYLLKVIEANRPKLILKHNTIELYAIPNATLEQKHNTLYNWYKRELEAKIGNSITDYAKVMNITDVNFGIRKMKTKWGSCSIEKRMLWFNIELVKKPIDCIEYIVVHELVHLLERNHNKNFIILMDRFLPNWRMQKKILNELPL
ncbi:putative metal-dependent hydrolase [Chryseobacterium sp. PvR013]|uniref:M48 family metallopeptidase n=1 Tax=Chryseobacterium sp. PvR013 TaxID=2806595 RepID=UPI001AEA7D82|nr:SprT family zinc-dependent metalloprotease [Chryseobacterium sp. PvR013]MBP1167644.1 putative metal-dependent hydrolase [Chryseobacterium sp. PvR013]